MVLGILASCGHNSVKCLGVFLENEFKRCKGKELCKTEPQDFQLEAT